VTRPYAVVFALAVSSISAVPSVTFAGEPTRHALIALWATASHRSAAGLESRDILASPPAALPRLTAAELATPGRYHLTASVVEPPSPSWWSLLWNWLRDRWNDLWRAAFGRAHVGRMGSVAIGDVLLAIVALLLVIVTIRLLAALTIDRRRHSGEVRFEAEPVAGELYAKACAFARRADYAQASTALFAAAIAALAERGAVQDDSSATVGDVRRALGASQRTLVAPFNDVASAFVTSAYAQQPVAAADWERARSAYLRFAAEPA